MGWDGNGAFTRTKDWTTDRDAATKILASRHDENDDELTTGIAACITKNGESKPTADLRPNADATYSFGSAALRWINVWISNVLQFKQANFIGSLAQATLTADRTNTLPDVSGTLVSTGVPGEAADVVTDYMFFRDNTDGLAKIANITTLAAQFFGIAPAASTGVAGKVELATTAETFTGTDDTRAISPSGFAGNITVSGNRACIKLPGGLMVNLGKTSYTDPTTSDTFLVAFPNNLLALVDGYLSGNANHNGVRWTAVSVSGFTASVNPGNGGATTIYWIAVGH